MKTEDQVLGDYEITRELGQGTFGTAFLVEHRYMKRPFVLKLLPKEIAEDAKFVERLQSEVGILSTIDHPNIAKLHTVSRDQDRYYLIIDAVLDDNNQSTTLTQYIQSKKGRLQEADLHHLLSQVASALDSLHSVQKDGRPLLHLGLKLSNILIGKGKDRPRIVLTDCGLSSLVGQEKLLNQTFAAAAQTYGMAEAGGFEENKEKLHKLHASFLQSFSFLSPEQKNLKNLDKLTVHSDIYAFGVLAYYLILGCAPEGYFPMPSSIVEQYHWDWDGLLALCLQTEAKNRPAELSSLMYALGSGEKLVGKKTKQTSWSETPSEQDYEVHESTTQDTDGSLKPLIRAAHLDKPTKDFDITQNLKVDTAVKVYHPEEDDVQDIKPIPTEMVVVQGGAFYRGSNEGNRDASPRHEIRVNSFAIDIHPVTNEQFMRFLQVMNGEKDRYHRDLLRLKESRIKRIGGKCEVESGYHKHPVVGVTWYGAVAYAKWVGKRLPFESEWEIAASGAGAEHRFPTGEEIDKTKANFFSTDTTPVQSYPPSSLGFYDMAGNVYEWCYDWYDYNYYGTSAQEPDKPKGPVQGVYRVLRGGCWKSSKEDLLCSRRHRNNPGTVNGTYGFRCAADVQ